MKYGNFIMIEDIVFETKSRGASEIRLQHSTGEVTVLGFVSTFPIQAKEAYLQAIRALLMKHQDLSPKDDMLGLFTFWFARNNLETPISAGTFRNDDRQRIGQRIRELREQRKMDARHLSQLTGIDAANICRIEQGKYSVGLDVLSKIANALGYKVDLVEL